MKIFLNMIVGSMNEEFLLQSLNSLDWVDYAVINVNGKNENNLKSIMESSLHKDKKIDIIESPFRNYAWNRNLCLEASKDADFIIQADPDEIFYKMNFREIIENADRDGYNRIFAYYMHCMKSMETAQNKDAEKDELYYKYFAFKNIFKWRNPSHEKICGDVPFKDKIIQDICWWHLGYISPEKVFERWNLFAKMEGEPHRYRNYFKDPRFPWRKEPKNILDDRPQFKVNLEKYPAPEGIK